MSSGSASGPERYVRVLLVLVLAASSIASVGWYFTYGIESLAEGVGLVLFALLSFGFWAFLITGFVVLPVWLLAKGIAALANRSRHSGTGSSNGPPL